MVTLNYPLKDLARRRTQTLTILACLIICSASVTFLFVMGLNLGFNVTTLPWRTSIGLHYIYSFYLLIALGLSLLTGLLIISNVVVTFTEQRQRDIGIMKAIGLTEQIGSFFMAETMIVTLIGCAIGSTLGVITYVVSIKILNILGYGLPLSLPFTLLLALFVILVLIAFIFSYFPLSRMVLGAKAIEAISMNLIKRTGNEGFLKWIKISFLTKIALRSLRARGKETFRILVLSMLCMILVSILIFGGQTISYTASNYVERGIGRDILLIAKPKVAEKYAEELSLYPPENGYGESDVSWQMNGISETFVAWLGAQSFIRMVDSRIVMEAKAFEIKYVKPIPGPDYVTIGDDRSVDAFVIGIKPEKTVSDWVLNERFLTKDDKDSAVIGDSMLDIVYDFKVEKIKVIEKTFTIIGVCIDPLNSGYTIYIPYETMSSMLGSSDPNVVLVKVDGNVKDEAVRKVTLRASEEGLTVLDLEPILERNTNLVEKLWTFISILPTMTLLSFIIGLASFLQLTIQSRITDFQIMKAVGAKMKDLSKIVTIELLIVILISIPFGVLIGSTVGLNFIISSPVFPPLRTLLLNLSIIGGLISVLFIGSRYIVNKTLRKQVYQR